MDSYFFTVLIVVITGIIAGGVFTLTRTLPKQAYVNLWMMLVIIAVFGTLTVNTLDKMLTVATVHTIKEVVLFCVAFLFSSWFVDHN